MGDPRGWEALTQQEAEQDARRPELDQLREWLASDGAIYGCTLTPGEAHLLADAFDVAVRERDQAQEALRRIAEGSTVIDYDTPSLAREIARAALAVGENATEGET